ncbi:hypothetical protein L1049_018877 [Liquidambar formosana]|uniref:Uncharacterized protein n=1 Tax=Liquidambar formosana TaxID=63359 RepID=A0AAP0RC98_LIQFO
MQSPCLDACKTVTTTSHQPLGFHHNLSSPSTSLTFFSTRISCSKNQNPRKLVNQKRQHRSSNGGGRVKVKGKDNVWSVDNEIAKAAAMAEKEKASDSRRRRRGGRKVRTSGQE